MAKKLNIKFPHLVHSSSERKPPSKCDVIIINGTILTPAQSTTLAMAAFMFAINLDDPNDNPPKKKEMLLAIDQVTDLFLDKIEED